MGRGRGETGNGEWRGRGRDAREKGEKGRGGRKERRGGRGGKKSKNIRSVKFLPMPLSLDLATSFMIDRWLVSGERSYVLQVYRCIFTQFSHLYTPHTPSACYRAAWYAV